MSTAFVYRTAPNRERMAARDIIRQGVHAEVPLDISGKRSRVTVPGYVFTGGHVDRAYSKHVKGHIGRVSVADVAGLYIGKRPVEPRPTNPFKQGQAVFKGEIPANVVETRGRLCVIEITMLGKTHRQAIHYSQLRPG